MENIREWIPAILIVVGTLMVSLALRSVLKRIKREGKWVFVRQLATSISNLIFIVGLRMFADALPSAGKLDFWVDSVTYVLAVLILLALVRRVALIAIEWSAVRSDYSKTLQLGFIPLMRNVITLFVFFMGAIMILKRFNYDVMSLLTALGVGSLAVGLAAKETLSNMISGFTLIIDQNLRPGDRINLAGSVGDVEEIGLRSTRIKTGDGNTLIVPNSELVNTKILNYSMPSRQKACSTTIRLPYSVPFPAIKKLCLEVAGDVSYIEPGRGRWANLSGVSEGHQVVSVGFWIRDLDDAGAATSEFHEKLLGRMKEQGLEPAQVLSPYLPQLK